MLYDNGATIASKVNVVGGTVQNTASYDFVTTCYDLDALSQSLAAEPANGTTTVNPFGGGGVYLEGTDTVFNVFDVAVADLDVATGVYVTAPAGSTVVIDISGTSVDISAFSIFLTGPTSADVLWNADAATEVNLEAIDFKGTLLAPDAALTFNNGQTEGQVIVDSVEGNGQYAFTAFDGDAICE